MAKKVKFDPEVDYRIAFNNLNEKGRMVYQKVNKELQDVDYLPYDMIRQYGDAFKKLLITTGIDYVMMGFPDVDKKREKIAIISEMGIMKRFMLYKDGLRVFTHDGAICDIMPLHGYVENVNDLWLKLRTEERHNDCHQGSWNLMSIMSDVKGKKLVTSFIKGATDDCEYLHTWIEFEENGEEKVADYTLNAVMNKDFYYSLRSVDRDNVCEISEEEFDSEKDIVESLVKNEKFDKRVYLFFREDLIEYDKDKFKPSESE